MGAFHFQTPARSEGDLDGRHHGTRKDGFGNPSYHKKAVAEMVATLYDESLDAYFPHNWMSFFGVFRQDDFNLNAQFENSLKNLQGLHGYWNVRSKDATMTYRSFPHEIIANLWGYQYFKGRPSANLGGFRDEKKAEA